MRFLPNNSSPVPYPQGLHALRHTIVASCGAVCNAASSYAAMCVVAGSHPVLVIVSE